MIEFTRQQAVGQTTQEVLTDTHTHTGNHLLAAIIPDNTVLAGGGPATEAGGYTHSLSLPFSSVSPFVSLLHYPYPFTILLSPTLPLLFPPFSPFLLFILMMIMYIHITLHI